MAFNNFPYSDAHELNLDWVIKKCKEAALNALEAIAQSEKTKTFVNNYFDNLNVQAEINSKIDSMASSGALGSIVDDYIPAVVTAWLDDNMTPGSGVVDKTLTVADAAADAKVTGEVVYNAQEHVKHNLITAFPNAYPPNGTYNGVTFTWDDMTSTYNVNGTATANSHYNFFADSTNMHGLVAESAYEIHVSRTNVNVQIVMFAYVNGSWSELFRTTTSSANYNAMGVVPANATGLLLRAEYPSGALFSNAKLKIELFGEYEPVVIERNQKYDNEIITHFLARYRYCKLLAGTHTLSNTLYIPTNSILEGVGQATTLTVSANTFDAIRIDQKDRITIRNLHLEGLVQNTPQDPTGYGAGIHIIGDANSSYGCRHIVIDNCQINFFAGGGIVAESNGYWPAKSISITNCECWNNYAGIWLKNLAEYNRVTNCLIYSNYIGILNNAGNNVFENCTISNNYTAFYIGESATINNGHGAVIGCTLNHNNENNGFAIIIRNVKNGFIFSGCNIWYGKIIISDSTGIVFGNCLIGRAVDPNIQSDDNTVILFNSCNFYEEPTLVGNVIFNSCYTYDGTLLT